MDTETLLVARQLLGVADLTETDDLFDAGMTSLAALALADGLSDVLGREVTVADVYVGGTIEQIVQIAAAAAAQGPLPGRPSVAEEAQLSRAQQRFWIAEQFAPAGADNMLVLGYAVIGPLKPEVLERALAGVLERHEALRTFYPLTDKGMTRRVVPIHESRTAIEIVDPPDGLGEPESVAEHITADWWDTPFALDQQPPLRVRLCRIDATTHLLCLHTHHIAFDGRSEQIFLADLSSFYALHLGTATSASVVAFDSLVSRNRQADIEQAELEFWRRTLAEAPPPFLPAPPVPTDEATRAEVVRRVPAETVDRIRTATRLRRAPTVAALVACMARACAEVFGISDLCLGTVTDDRSSQGPSTAIGYFVNPLAVPLTAVADRDAADLFDHAAAVVLSSIQHSHIPFDELVRRLNPERGRHPWFQAWVLLQYPKPGGELSPGTTVRPIRLRPPRTATELSVEAFPQRDGSWEVQLGWRTDGCAEETVSALADRLVAALAETAETNRAT